MNARAMHYDFKSKLNKIDSEKFRNMKVPEIDWYLNEAQEMFIKMIAVPRYRQTLGFETYQRSTDDIRTIVVNNYKTIVTPGIEPNTYIAELPSDYMFYLASYVECKKNSCYKRLRTVVQQHDDKFQESAFDRSSFEWEDVNIRFFNSGIKIYTDGTFTVEEFYLDYIKFPDIISNALDSTDKKYLLPDSTLLDYNQPCELPDQTHREIVDLAVYIAQISLTPDPNAKKAKMEITN